MPSSIDSVGRASFLQSYRESAQRQSVGDNLSELLKQEGLSVSKTSKAFKKIEQFLNLGAARTLSTEDLSPAEQLEFFKMMAALLKLGIVGYKDYEIDGKPQRHYLVTSIGNSALYNKRVYTEKRSS